MRATWIQLCYLGLLACLATTIARADPIDVGTRKQLFVDGKFIESAHGVELVMHTPHQTGEVLIAADQPHEKGGHVSVYSSVLKDNDGRIRIWYDLVTPTGPGPWDHERRVCYAESDDGIRFTKPELGLHEVDGSTANNVVLPGVIGGCAVWLDPNAPPEQRFRTQAKSYHPTRALPMHSSPDGLRWDLFLERPNLTGPTDTQTIIFWDAAVQRYAMYTRDRIRSPLSYRAVRRLESDDLKEWDCESRVFEPDEADLGTYEASAGVAPVDYYGATVFKYPGVGSEEDRTVDDGVYIMLAQAFWHWMPRGAPGTRDVRLAVSRDGRDFQRVGSRKPFLGPGPAGRFDSQQIWIMPDPIVMGDELWLYYAGMNWNRVSPPGVDPQAPDGKRLSAISRAIMRLDGFVSAAAPYEGGELVTPLIQFEGNRLELNVDTSGGGALKVEIVGEDGNPIRGFAVSEADWINGNSVKMPVSWNGRQDVSSLAGQPLRLRFVMRDCNLYAFQFVE